MTLAAGRLRHRIDIEEQVRTRDPVTGGYDVTWQVKHASVPADIKPVSIKEFIAGQSQDAQIEATIKIRHRAGLDHSMRINHNGKIYAVHGWLPDTDSGLEFLTAPCSAGVQDGR